MIRKAILKWLSKIRDTAKLVFALEPISGVWVVEIPEDPIPDHIAALRASNPTGDARRHLEDVGMTQRGLASSAEREDGSYALVRPRPEEGPLDAVH